MLYINTKKMSVSYLPNKKYENIYKDSIFNNLKKELSDFISTNEFKSLVVNNKIVSIAFSLKKDCDIDKLKNTIKSYNEKGNNHKWIIIV